MKRVLAEPLSELQETARMIAAVSNECKIPVNEDEYVESFAPVLMDVVHAWSKVLFLHAEACLYFMGTSSFSCGCCLCTAEWLLL